MAVTSGFFNSVNGDRKYNAEQISALFNSIINDGVFSNVGTAFSVKANTGNSVTVGIGRAWFNSTWLDNDALLSLTLEASELALDRIDAVVIEIDRTEDVRNGSIKVIKGTPASAAKNPEMIATQYVHQYPLAYIRRQRGSSSITQSDITNAVGTSSCPYITGILQVQNIDNIVDKWETQWWDWVDEQQSDFSEWFASLKAVLEDDVATALATRITDMESKVALISGSGGTAHRRIFRGKYLGSAVTPEQSRAISSGTFTDLYVGDYWEASDGIKWRIADFDYWYKFGDTPCNTHHVVIVPDKPLYTAPMNATTTTVGGYVNSSMRKAALTHVGLNIIERSMFSGASLQYREFLITVTEHGFPSEGAWMSTSLELMNEYMVYGAPFYNTANGGTTVPKLYNNSGRQLALFELAPKYIIGDVEGSRASYWLRDIVSDTRFAQVTSYGPINEVNASATSGVRPAFGFVG